MIFILAGLIILERLQCCPFKNTENIFLPQDNLIQLSKFENQLSQFSYSFNLWIQYASHFNPRAYELVEKPFDNNKLENGEIIFRLYERNKLRIIIYKIDSNEVQGQFQIKAIIWLQSVFEGFDQNLIYISTLQSTEQTWIMILITILPFNGQIILEISEQISVVDIEIQALLNNVDYQNNLEIVSGGHCFINDELNLNIFKGRFTKQNHLSSILWTPFLFKDLIMLCMVPDKIVTRLKNQQFENNSCHLNCKTCLENEQNYPNCASCDQSLNFVLRENKCQCPYDLKEAFTRIHQVFICVPINIMYPQFNIIELPIPQVVSCKFGEFSIKNLDETLCSICPNNSDNIICIECLQQMHYWYLKPVCKSDFIYQQSLAQEKKYKYQIRLKQNFDVYSIDHSNSLYYLYGVEDYCDQELLEEGCFPSAYNHLGKKAFIKCKIGFVQISGLCIYKAQETNQQNIKCLNGQFYYEGKCIACQIGCYKCVFHSQSNKIQCLECQINFFLVSNNCVKCGQFCLKCLLFNNISIDTQYLKCVKCIDDSKYFFSFDGINCEENKIQNCQYAFQVYKNDLQISTLDYDFVPQFNQNEIQVYCARCDKFYVFSFQTQKCYFLKKYNYCLYAVADNVVDDQLNQQFQNLKCLLVLGEENNGQLNCQQDFDNCQVCYMESEKNMQCLSCFKGYYKSRMNGKCYKCQIDYCEICLQQNIYEEDGWKENIRPFYQSYVRKSYPDLNLKLFTFPFDSTNLQIKCVQCQLYLTVELINGKCVSQCDTQCEKCQIDQKKEIFCKPCYGNILNQIFQPVHEKCLFCQENCLACLLKTHSEITSINPYYSFSKEFENFFPTYKCYKFEKIEEQFYDDQISELVECKIYKNGCEKQFVMEEAFTCELLKLFFSKNSALFSFFYNNRFKTIILKIISTKSLVCKINELIQIEQYFSKSVLSLINIKLEFLFSHQIVWEIESEIRFLNFRQVTINGLQINILDNQLLKKISFYSLGLSIIYFTNCTIYSHSNPIHNFQIEFFNTTQISIVNCSLNSLMLYKSKGIFIFHSIGIPKNIFFLGLTLINCKFQFSTIFDFQLNTENDYVEIQLTSTQNIFKSSSIFQNITDQLLAQMLYIHDFILLNTQIIDTPGLIQSSNFQKLKIFQMNLVNLSIINSDFLYLAQTNSFDNIQLLNSKLNTSNLISTKATIKATKSKQFFQNLKFQNNVYSANTKFISLSCADSSFSNVTMHQINLINNTLNKQLDIVSFLNLQNTLIFIEAQFILLQEIVIIKAFGVIDLSISNSKSLQIINSYISQSADYKIFGLHQHFDCIIPFIKGNAYPTSIFIYSAQFVQIVRMNITGVQTINYPLIFYESNYRIAQLQKEEFYFQQWTVNQNLIIQNQIEAQVALVMFVSTQQTLIIIENCTFFGNILQFYQGIEITNSAILFSFQLEQSEVIILGSLFMSNLVLNGENSIIFIKSKQISLTNCTYTYNNYLQYEILKPYLLWTSNDANDFSLEDLENIFSIQSISGNGQYEAEEMKIISCVFSNSQGTKGAGIYFYYYSASSIILESIKFENIALNFYIQRDHGSAIFISGNRESNVKINVQNLTANKIFSNQFGGVIQMSETNGNISLELSNIYLIDVYSKTGQLIFFSSSLLGQKSQNFKITNVSMKNSDAGFNQFLIYLIQWENKSSFFEEIELTFQRKIIHLEQISTLSAKSVIFQDIIFESPFWLVNISKVTLSKIEIRDSVLFNHAILISPNQLLPGVFILESSIFFNLTVQFQIRLNSLSINMNRNQTIQLKCNSQIDAPETLKPLISQTVDFSEIIFNFSYNLHPESVELLKGIILLNQFNQDHQVLLDDNQFSNIFCQGCTKGLIFVSLFKVLNFSKRQEISNLIITNSFCGQSGCLIIKIEYPKNYSQNSSIKQDIEFFIYNYFCQFNLAINGTCLNVENINILIQNSEFKKNNASRAGGAVYILQSIQKEQIVFQGTVISDNQAKIAGGIYSNSQINLNFKKLDSVIDNNNAEFFADDIAVLPSRLQIDVNDEENNLFEIITLVQNDSYKLEQYQLKNLTNLHGINTLYYIFPSGIEISQYQYFNWRNRSYIPIKFKFRIKAMSEEGVEMKDQSNSYCKISSGINNIKNLENISFTNNYTNYQTVIFNDETMDYNLDDLIIYFQSLEKEQNALLLEFWCNSIFVPKYNKMYPYNLILQHQSYHLRIQIQTFPCQLGEIQNETLSSCQTCNAEKGFFSFNIKSLTCQIRDEISTKEVQPAQLNLKNNFWRPYFDSNQPSQCLNKNENCLGGWLEGDGSCLNGHIGALCEQCDINNIRGNGYYFQNTQYNCSSCEQKKEEELFAFFGIMWSLITIGISVLGSIKTQGDHLQALKLRIIGFKLIIKHKPQSILIKIIINYFQNLGVLASFQIQYPFKTQIFLYFTTQTILPQSLNCYFNGTSSVEIMYQMSIYQLLLPIIYMSFFIIFYGIGYLIKKIKFTTSVLASVGLYLFIYFQPSIIKNLLSGISYRYISGYYWIAANVSYRYDRENHFIWIYQFYSPAIFLISLVIPLILSYKLLKNRNNLENQKVASMWGYLYDDYNRRAYFWELLKILQKELLIFFIVFYEDFLILKCLLFVLLMTIYSLLNLHFKPFKLAAFNSLDYKSAKVLIFSFILLLGIYQSQISKSNIINYLSYAFLIIINANFIGQLFIQLFITLKLKQKIINKFNAVKNIVLKKYPSLQKKFRWFSNNQMDKQKIQGYFHMVRQHLKRIAKANLQRRNQSSSLKKMQS